MDACDHGHTWPSNERPGGGQFPVPLDGPVSTGAPPGGVRAGVPTGPHPTQRSLIATVCC